MNIVILGTQLGDEAKARFIHSLSSNFQFLVRFSSGSNCGHTLYTNGVKFVHHLVPSINFETSSAKGYIAAGCVVGLDDLLSELQNLEKVYPGVSKRIYVDEDAFLVTSLHKETDKAKNTHIGTTNKGIGPTYMSKTGRYGIRVGDVEMFSNDELIELLRKNSTQEHDDSHYSSIVNNLAKDYEELLKLGVTFTTVLSMKKEFQESNILFEGSQGMLLDLNWGTYPFVTSTDCGIASIYSSGFGFVKIDDVYGVMKPYVTKVGEGPFPTKIQDKEAEEALRQKAGEFGATTGRPRQCGWLDLPALKYAVEKGNMTKLCIAKLDIFAGLPEFKVCTSYGHEVNSPRDFFNASSKTYQTVGGWNEVLMPDGSLSPSVESFLKMVSDYVGVPFVYVSYGVDENSMRKV